MTYKGILIKDFRHFVEEHSQMVKKHAIQMAQKKGRPYEYLRSKEDKEARARVIARKDNISHGLICIFGTLEASNSFKVLSQNGHIQIKSCVRKCLCLYFYFLDKELGLIHIRLATWFPFPIQIYLNGHEWLAKKLEQHHIGFEKEDNAFVRIENYERAQRLANRFSLNPRHLNALASKVNPLLGGLLKNMEYYWIIEQAEYATDIIFKSPEHLTPLYDRLLQHILMCFSAKDVLTFLGKKLTGCFKGDVMARFTKRWPGSRIKHWCKQNWIKMYNKHGMILRVETGINHPYDFMIRRRGVRHGKSVMGWFPMAKRISNLYRYAEISQTANQRYLDALSIVDAPRITEDAIIRLSKTIWCKGRAYRGLNPFSNEDLTLVRTMMSGEHCLQGFRNRDIRCHLFQRSKSQRESRFQSARISRLFQRLHIHGLIAKIPHSRRWRITAKGNLIMSTILSFFEIHSIPHTLCNAA